MYKWTWLSVVVVVLDQASKYIADTRLLLHSPVDVFPMLNFTLMYNSGAAFSFLSQAGGWQRWFFIILTSIISIVLLVWLGRLERHEKRTAIAVSLVLGGAVGNLIDRSLFGYVIDFIDVYYESFHWPAFNIADSAISLGVFLLIIDILVNGDKKGNHE